MKNGFEIIWSDEAKYNLSKIIEYLEKNWTEKETRIFFQKLEKTIGLISENPQLFQVSPINKDIHKCVLTKQISVYYKVDKTTVYIITLFDNRQDPANLKIK